MASGSRGGSGGNGRGGRGKSIVDEHEPYVPHLSFDPNADFELFPDAVPPEIEQFLNTEESLHGPTEASTTMETSSRPHKSVVWNHFNKEVTNDGPNIFKLICKHCTRPKPYSWRTGQGYGTMMRHLNEKHPEVLGTETSQRKISAYGTSAPPFHFNLETYKNEFARLVSVAHLSYSFAERLGVVEFMQKAVNPQAVRIPRNTVKRRIAKLYNEDKSKLVEYFQCYDGSVHIGSDIWSDHWQTFSYMGLTCHWIDEQWTIQKRVLAFRVFPERHTAENIAFMIRTILREYGLLNRVFSIGFDNAAANTASIPQLIQVCRPSFGGKFFHIRCVCHVLNLCVQAGLEVLQVFLSQIHKAVGFLWRYPSQMTAWFKFCKEKGYRKRKFSKPVSTRWNSTYMLLNETCGYKELLCDFIGRHAPPDCQVYPNSWNVCEKILKILAVFNNSTLVLSGVYYPTCHLFLLEACNIAESFEIDVKAGPEEEKLDDATIALLESAIDIMRKKWLNYYREIPLIYLLASVFDPRIRLDTLVDYLQLYYNAMRVTDVNILDIQENVRTHVVEVYKDFASRSNVGTSSSSSFVDTVETSKLSRAYRLLHSKAKKQKGVVGDGVSELDSYLNVSFEFEKGGMNLDLLDWWKRHATDYPILASIAKQVLATPCSTVAVEQVFSTGGNILDDERSQLLPENLEKQVCLDDWTKASYRQQEIDRKAYEFFDDEDDSTNTGTGSD